MMTYRQQANTSTSRINGNVSFLTTTSPVNRSVQGFGSEVLIPLYSVIFILSVVGNILVIVTLSQNRRMRTVTNIFLLNLAVADLLLGVFCMPFTLIGQLLRDFIFGSLMCHIIPYLQAVSVSVGVWTLVAISLERYFAICRPLKSRIWQTRRHAYKMILAVWILSLALCLPIAIVNRLKPIRDSGRHKCREEWPEPTIEKSYSVVLDVTLLFLPLLIMGLAYWLIAARLWEGLRHITSTTRLKSFAVSPSPAQELPPSNQLPHAGDDSHGGGSRLSDTSHMENFPSASKAIVIQWPVRDNHRRLCSDYHSNVSDDRECCRKNWRRSTQRNASSAMVQIMDYRSAARYGVRQTYTDKSIWAKKKIIRMLFVIVLEFFLCWTPLYVINTWYAFDAVSLYNQIESTEIALIQLLAYLSSCCNPITYCFMNEKFRNGFLNAFGCGQRAPARTRSIDLLSASINDSSHHAQRSVKGNS